MGRLADAHIHLFTARDLEAYEVLRRRHGIEQALVVGYEGAPGARGNNRAIAEWRATRPWMTCLAYLPCESPGSPEALDDLWSRGFRGVSVYALTPAAARAVAAWPAAVTQWLNEQRAVVSFNAPPEGLNLLGDLFDRLDRCACLISHLGLPGVLPTLPAVDEARERLGALLALASRPWVGVKVSGLYATGAYPHRTAWPILHLLHETFGPERLYWGSDFPPCLAQVSFARTIDCLGPLGLPPASLPGIVGGNLARMVSRAGA